MTTTTIRRDSSHKQMQKRVPADVLARARELRYPITLPAVGTSPKFDLVITIQPVIKISMRVPDPSAAKRRVVAVTEQLERIFDSIRAGPIALDHRTTVALAGEVYRLVREHWER